VLIAVSSLQAMLHAEDSLVWSCFTCISTMMVVQVSSLTPDKFTPTLIKRTNDYVYFEFQSPTFGFIDDVRTHRPAMHHLPQSHTRHLH
jgi:uncharacterized protein (DUF1499 family)